MKLNCAGIEERIAAYLVDDLTAQERFWIEMHLRDCAECRAEIDSLADIAGSLQADFEAEPDFELDPARRAALSAQFAKANPDIDIATRRRWRRIRAMAANMSVAAALLVGAYLGFVTGNQRVQQPAAPEFTLEIASTNYSVQTTKVQPATLVSGPVSGIPYMDLSPIANFGESALPGATLASYPGVPLPRSGTVQSYSFSE